MNYDVNTKIQPLTDQEIYGVEENGLSHDVGDCEDYVLLKQKLLINKGFSPADLLITVVLQPNGEGHAVLTVRTDRGDFVLDNMRNKVCSGPTPNTPSQASIDAQRRQMGEDRRRSRSGGRQLELTPVRGPRRA